MEILNIWILEYAVIFMTFTYALCMLEQASVIWDSKEKK